MPGNDSRSSLSYVVSSTSEFCAKDMVIRLLWRCLGDKSSLSTVLFLFQCLCLLFLGKLLAGMFDFARVLGGVGLGGGVGGSPGKRSGYERQSLGDVGILPTWPVGSPSPMQKPPLPRSLLLSSLTLSNQDARISTRRYVLYTFHSMNASNNSTAIRARAIVNCGFDNIPLPLETDETAFKCVEFSRKHFSQLRGSMVSIHLRTAQMHFAYFSFALKPSTCRFNFTSLFITKPSLSPLSETLLC